MESQLNVAFVSGCCCCCYCCLPPGQSPGPHLCPSLLLVVPALLLYSYSFTCGYCLLFYSYLFSTLLLVVIFYSTRDYCHFFLMIMITHSSTRDYSLLFYSWVSYSSTCDNCLPFILLVIAYSSSSARDYYLVFLFIFSVLTFLLLL